MWLEMINKNNEPEPEYYSFYRVCGMPFTIEHSGGAIKGILIDWQGQRTRDIFISICDECRDKLDQFDFDGIEGAIERRRTMYKIQNKGSVASTGLRLKSYPLLHAGLLISYYCVCDVSIFHPTS